MARVKPLLEILADEDKSLKKGDRASLATVKWDQALPKAQKVLTPAQYASLKVYSHMAQVNHLLKEFHSKQAQK